MRDYHEVFIFTSGNLLEAVMALMEKFLNILI